MMNKAFKSLFELIQKPSRNIISLMSGTSVDGLTLSLCEMLDKDFQTSVKLKKFESVPYPIIFKNKVLDIRSKKTVDLEKLCRLNVEIAQQHAEIIYQCIEKWGISLDQIDLIASHGQTIYHAPHDDFNSTLQLGDGDHLAVLMNKIVLSDFRQKHIAKGGEGAPLALYGDYLLGSSATENRLLLNLGGIANFTWLPKSKEASKVFATDTGPANTLMDTFCKENFHKAYDANGMIARSGENCEALVAEWLSHPYFIKASPKSTGQEIFDNDFIAIYKKYALSNEDVLCSLCHLSAKSIALSMALLPDQNFNIYASGGGVFNSFLMELIAHYSQKEVFTTENIGIEPESKESVIFALLANQTLVGSPISIGQVKALHMGKISFPD